MSKRDELRGMRLDERYEDIVAQRVIPMLVEFLGDRDELFVRPNAAHALEEIGKDAVPALVAALKNRNADIRRGAVSALEGIAEKTEVDLELVKKALGKFVGSVKQKGTPVEVTKAETEAAGYLIRITNAAAKFKAKSDRTEGVQLEGSVKPPRDKMYRQLERRAFA